MTRTLKPLLRPEVVRERLRTFELGPEWNTARRKLALWADLLGRSDSRKLTEQNLKPGFIAEILGEVLGYRTISQAPDSFTISPEFATPTAGFADAAIGNSPKDGRNVVMAVEIKGPFDPLDLPHGGRRLSAVEQGFDYAINLSCDWILVTSMAETRLYYKGADRFTCERFDLQRLAASEDAFRHFVYLLGAERIVPTHGRCHLYELLEESKTAGENITKAFYREYSQIRADAFAILTAKNPTQDKKAILSATQKLLDRIIFCAFAEDRGLLPANTIQNAYNDINLYNPRPRWENFCGLFKFVDKGNDKLRIPRYNGGLFAPDPVLDGLTVPDEVCEAFTRLAAYDFRSLDSAAPLDEPAGAKGDAIIDVEILGHIFEQSITDLERIRLELEGKVEAPDPKQAKARRKKEGAFYTPRFITRYIVEQSLGPVMRERLETLRATHFAAAKASARKPLEDPTAYDLAKLNDPQREALLAFWTDWQAQLGRLRILDPACGSGAFLIEAFDQLLAAYQDVNARLEALRGAPEIFDLSRQILQQNLYGVDLNEEAVEICRLSLWIKTAERGKMLTDLDHTIRIGNSIVDDPTVHPLAFDWRGNFPEVFADGGFDVVVGNPPYIRQEWLAPYKEFLKGRYQAFSGTADLYIYFVERGLEVLKQGGRLGFITSGTFSRGNFAVPFRHWLPTVARFASVVNFGENQPFEGAEMVYPTISILEKRTEPATFPTLFIHEEIPTSLDEAMEAEGLPCDQTVFDGDEWKFQPREATALFDKIMNAGRPLGEVCKGRMYRGILTGLNEAFVIDTPTRDALVARDARSAEILKPILKGEDLRPWYQDWEGNWLVSIPCGFTAQQMKRKPDVAEGRRWFASEFPAVASHLAAFEEAAQARTDQGDYWWELRACAYHAEFETPKTVWPDICKLPRFSWDSQGSYLGNTGYTSIVPNLWTLAVLQSRLFWFQISQTAQSLRLRGGLWQYRCFDGFLRPLSIAIPEAGDEAALSNLAQEITALARERHGLHTKTRKRIATDLAAEGGKLNNALTAWWTLDFKTFRGEVNKALKNDIPVREREDWEAALRDWRGEHERMTARIVALEEEMNDRVYRLFGLTRGDITTLEDFMKRTKTFYPLGEV